MFLLKAEDYFDKMLMEKVGTGNEKMETTKNLRALYLAKILYEQTDEDYPLSTNQLIEALEKEFGISAHRVDRKSTRLNSSHTDSSRMPSSA